MTGNFVYYNPTKLFFGDDAQKHLADALKPFGKNVLLAYGGGSIKKNGVYDDVTKALNEAGKTVVELPGVMPNPTIEKIEEGVKLVKGNNIDFILAVGGGSTIDYAKGLSAAASYDGDAWQHFWIEQAEPDADAKLIPIGAVLTMSGTGSEMNGGSVITNHAQKLKIGKVFGPRLMPKFAILNPKYTFSLPYHQMVAGMFDIMSHLLEQYMSGNDDNTSDYLNEGLMKSLVVASRVAVKDPKNYEARSNIMWTATWALNTLIKCGKKQDWMVHMIGQAVGAHTDATHGMTLSAVSSAYYRHIMDVAAAKLARFAVNVWDVPAEGKKEAELALAGIECLERWIEEIGAATNISSLGVTEEMLDGIAKSTIIMDSGFKKLTHDEILTILRNSL